MQYAFEILHRLGIDTYIGVFLTAIIAVSVIRYFLNRS
jgi:hypothetical protein